MAAGKFYKAPRPSKTTKPTPVTIVKTRKPRKKAYKQQIVRCPGIGLPERIQTKLQYTVVKSLTAASATSASIQSYRLNSPYDPDYTGVGSQPVWFDYLSDVYDAYLVRGAYIEAECLNSTAQFAEISYMTSSDLMAGTDDIEDRQGGRMMLLQGNQGSGCLKRVKRYYNIGKELGLSRSNQSLNGGSQLESTTGSNPALPLFFQIFLRSPASVSTTVWIKFRVTMLVEFYRQKESATAIDDA